MRILVAVAFVVALASAASADEVLLNDGSAVDGEIQEVDQTGIRVVADGKTVEIEPANLDAHYYYQAWSRRAPKEAESHLRLAVFAYENGMFNQARSQYRKAQKLDPALVKKFEEETIPEIKEGIADNLLVLAQKAVERKDWTQAKRLTGKILTQLEDTKAAEKAHDLLASVHLWQLDADKQRFVHSVAKYLPREDEKRLAAQAKITKKLEPIQSRMRKAQDLVAQGLRTKTSSRQKGIFQTAAHRFENVIKDIDKLAADGAGDEALQAYIGETRAVAVREAVDAYVHAGSVNLIRRDYQNAIDMANKALLLDPDNQHAQRFQQQVIRGSQMRSGWWGRGGR